MVGLHTPLFQNATFTPARHPSGLGTVVPLDGKCEIRARMAIGFGLNLVASVLDRLIKNSECIIGSKAGPSQFFVRTMGSAEAVLGRLYLQKPSFKRNHTNGAGFIFLMLAIHTWK